MATAKDIAQSILRNRGLYEDLVRCLQYAAYYATQDPEVYASANTVCVLPMNTKGITRFVKPVCVTINPYYKVPTHSVYDPASGSYVTKPSGPYSVPNPVIYYNPSNLTIVGGSAINGIEFVRKVTNIPYELLGYATRTTSDIDAVWWPTTYINKFVKEQIRLHSSLLTESPMPITEPIATLQKANEFAIVSSSKAIETLVRRYEYYLQIYLNKFMEQRMQVLGTIFPQLIATHPAYFTVNVTNPDSPDTPENHKWKVGVWNVSATLHLGGFKMELLDLAIHDGASSQLQFVSPPEMYLEPMTLDPIYCEGFQTQTDKWHIHKLPFITLNAEGKPYLYPTETGYTSSISSEIPIPNLLRLIDQQVFAMKRRIGFLWHKKTQEEKKGIVIPYETLYSLPQYKDSVDNILLTHGRIRYLFELVNYVWKDGADPNLRIMFGLRTPSPTKIQELVTSFQTVEDFLVSCPYPQLNACKIPQDSELFAELCKQGKVIKSSLCPPPKTGGKSKKQRNRTRKHRGSKRL
jgi:hypothetical protein